MNRDQFWLTEAPFARIEPHLPTDTRGEPRVDDRESSAASSGKIRRRRTRRCSIRDPGAEIT